MNSLLNEFKYSFKKQDNGLIQIIILNVGIFVLTAIIYVFSKLLGDSRVFDFIYYKNMHLPSAPAEFLTRPWTIVTYFFSHSINNIFHILFNMLALYWFGRLIMEYLGHRRFVNIYIIGGLVAGVVFLMAYNFIPALSNQPAILIGASGSVYAVVVAAATLAPDYRFYMIFLGPVKIVYIAAFFVFISFLGSVGDNSGGNLAHLGGALLGFVYIKQLKKGRDIGKPISAMAAFFQKLGRNRHLKVSYKNKNPKANVKVVPDEKEIDAILDKISVSGYESLTREEKEKLFKASQK
ncbi:rhomboid family intramembrane serine protease [Cytophagaceae bacterium ABcell3]|nr:rhomboid family intramembrane serine protease [Cytophagaceae bacterium ABcell3]